MIVLDNLAGAAARLAERHRLEAEKARAFEESCIRDGKPGDAWEPRHAAETKAAIYRDIAADLGGTE